MPKNNLNSQEKPVVVIKTPTRKKQKKGMANYNADLISRYTQGYHPGKPSRKKNAVSKAKKKRLGGKKDKKLVLKSKNGVSSSQVGKKSNRSNNGSGKGFKRKRAAQKTHILVTKSFSRMATRQEKAKNKL